MFGSPGRTRTADKVVNSHLLYQLSYRGIEPVHQPVLDWGRINRKRLLSKIHLRVNKYFQTIFRPLFGLTPMPIPFILTGTITSLQ